MDSSYLNTFPFLDWCSTGIIFKIIGKVEEVNSRAGNSNQRFSFISNFIELSRVRTLTRREQTNFIVSFDFS